MGIKNTGPSNPIILEGLWGIGKTVLAEEYTKEHNYQLLREPLHREAENVVDIEQWYIENHSKRQSGLEDRQLLERSVLSTYAFSFALQKPAPNTEYILSLKDQIVKTGTQVVYVSFEDNIDLIKHTNIEKYSDDIQSILTNEDAMKRYHEWYTEIMPRTYGILPFIVRGIKNGERRTTKDMVNDIYLSLACERIAQVNVTCFHRFPDGKYEILVMKRNSKKGGFWQTLTGGIHPAESAPEAAKRELFEETGLTASPELLTWTTLTYSFQGDDNYILDEYVFGYEVSDIELVEKSDEHDEIAWLSPQDAIDQVKFDSNKSAIEAVRNETGRPL